jgi:hypothetical protein
MIQFTKVIGVTASLLILGSSLISQNASAASGSNEMTVRLSTSETMAPLFSLPKRCAGVAGAVGIGMTAGTGTLSIAVDGSPKIVNIPVVLTATDCPSPSTSKIGDLVFSQGQFLLAAANGNTISATYNGTFGVIDPVVPNQLKAAGAMYAITGGTGAFAGATGTGTLTGTETIYSPPPLLMATGTLNASGSISLPNKNFVDAF